MPEADGSKSFLMRILYRVRDYRSRVLFDMLERHVSGTVLDVGGWEFVKSLERRNVRYDRWVIVENDPDRLCVTSRRVALVHSDGCDLGVAPDSVDTVVSLQVLEHVFEPIRMVNELARVLKPGGYGVLLLPTTGTMHLAPHFHQNFSRYWIFEAMRRAQLEIVEFRELGGVWSSMASHMVFFFLQAARVEGMTDRQIRRSPLFFALLPLQAIFALVAIPICMVLSLGDLHEEPNNHAVVVRKPVNAAPPQVGEVAPSSPDAVATTVGDAKR